MRPDLRTRMAPLQPLRYRSKDSRGRHHGAIPKHAAEPARRTLPHGAAPRNERSSGLRAHGWEVAKTEKVAGTDHGHIRRRAARAAGEIWSRWRISAIASRRVHHCALQL